MWLLTAAKESNIFQKNVDRKTFEKHTRVLAE